MCGLPTIYVLRSTDANGRPAGSNDAPLLENARRDRCCLRNQYLDSNESNKQYSHKSQQSYNTPIAPLNIVNIPKSQMIVQLTHSIRQAAPLKCQQETDHTR